MSIVHGFGQITDRESLKILEIAGNFLDFSEIAYLPCTVCIEDLSQIRGFSWVFVRFSMILGGFMHPKYFWTSKFALESLWSG